MIGGVAIKGNVEKRATSAAAIGLFSNGNPVMPPFNFQIAFWNLESTKMG